MPTGSGDGGSPTPPDNALDLNAIPAEKLEDHPYVKELKTKASAAHKGMDSANLTKKQLEAEVARLKVMAGEEKPKEEKPESEFVTKEDLWTAQNEKDIELYGDEQYQKELDLGVPKKVALQYAKLRHQKDPNQAQVMRQQAMASQGSTSTRDLSDIDITDEDRADMKKWGYSEKALKRQKQLKKARE